MVWETFRSGAKVPGPLKAQRWVFSGWTLTKYQGTVHSPYTHVYSIIAQVPIPRCAAHVSWKGLFFLTVKPQTLPTACKALFLCLPPRPPCHLLSLLPGQPARLQPQGFCAHSSHYLHLSHSNYLQGSLYWGSPEKQNLQDGYIYIGKDLL